ncbi:UNVERIFIED_ORG: DNA-binding transcriptional MocR family regulator [Variovorax guangxiensis]
MKGHSWTRLVTAAIACGWLEDGTVDRLESQKRQDAAARQIIVGEELAGLKCVRHPSSYFAWLPLPEETRADRVATALGAVGLDGLCSALRTVRRVVGEQAF